MFIRFFIKEWKEKILIFFMAVLFLAALAGIRLAGKDELTMYLSGMFLWFFLPFAGLMIGASGFYTEHKNNAWTYLFSLPIKKPAVWMIKYFSQLTILLAVYGTFLFLVLFLPGLRQLLEVFSFSSGFIHYSALPSSLLISVTLFSLAFSLSILHDKPFIIFLAAVFTGTGTALAVQGYSDWLYRNYFGMNELLGISFLWPLAFIFGSLYAFSRSDFTRTPIKLWRFIKITAAGLVFAGLLSTGLTLADWHFQGRDYMYNLVVRENHAYFRTKKGTLHYDKEKDKRKRITRQRSRIAASRSGDKFLLLTYEYQSEGPLQGYVYELIFRNTAGTENIPLIQTAASGTPFTGLRILSFDISPDGKWGAAVSDDPETGESRLWRIFIPENNIQSIGLELPGSNRIDFAGWGPGNDTILFIAENRGKKGLYALNFQSGSIQDIASTLRKPHLAAVSLSQQHAAYVILDPETNEEVLESVALSSMNKTEIIRSSLIQDIQWGKEQDILAFTFKGPRAGIFDIDAAKIETSPLLSPITLDSHFPSLDWINHDQVIAARSCSEDSCRILILSPDWAVQKSIETPFPSFRAVYGMGRTVFVYNQKENQLWRYSLDKENWKKIY
jgi:hypothetical protein